MTAAHTFHIPVMGLGFTIDTPAKVAQYGISSVISIVDDGLIEKMREFYCKNRNSDFHPISDKFDDFRAKRITAYLNLMDEIVREKFATVRDSVRTNRVELEKYLAMLPSQSALRQKFHDLREEYGPGKAWEWIQSHISPGKIDVNIMTKLDKTNFKGKEKLASEYSDAHAALRGFANSTLESSVVLSAGMNPRLYGYMENFTDFYPDDSGHLKKQITLKVSDYRSALIQGKFLAKKGLWVSEFRIESGLNCGGHAFATDGYLMGPILEEFSENRDLLQKMLFKTYQNGLEKKGHKIPETPFDIKITAQGGVGTAEEHQFLQDHYDLDSVGWGTPFLLVPEAVSIDAGTIRLLQNAKEDDLYLSGISPLGVPFNNIRGNTKDLEKEQWITNDRAGSPCPKKYVQVNTEFTEKPICKASRKYQYLKIQQLNEQDLDPVSHQIAYNRIVEKACICVGLGTAALLSHEIDATEEGDAVSVCPGPNMAYFSETVSLQKMADHIYGRDNVIRRKDRPQMFIKELSLYVNYLKEKMTEAPDNFDETQWQYFQKFRQNLLDGIDYYRKLFNDIENYFRSLKSELFEALNQFEEELYSLIPEQKVLAE